MWHAFLRKVTPNNLKKVISKQQFLRRCFIFFGLSLLDGVFTHYGMITLKVFKEGNPVILLLSNYIGLAWALWLMKIVVMIGSILLLYYVFNKQPELPTKVINLSIVAYVILDVVWIFLLLL